MLSDFGRIGKLGYAKQTRYHVSVPKSGNRLPDRGQKLQPLRAFTKGSRKAKANF